MGLRPKTTRFYVVLKPIFAQSLQTAGPGLTAKRL